MTRIAIWCLVALMALCGCKGQENGESSPKTQASAGGGASPAGPVPGGRLVQATIGEPSNLIPPLASDGPSHEVADLLYVAPLKYDKNIELVPSAATSFEVLDEGRLLRFSLREDVRWHDGVPVTAEDVEFTYKLMIDPKTPTAYAEDYKAIQEFKVTGPYSFEVRYEKPFARSLVTWAGAILPKHALAGEDLLKTKYIREPLGAGPYRLKEWIPGTRLTLVANPDYFEGRPYIDEVVYRVIPDQSTQFLELKAGNLDMMSLSPQQYLHQTSGPAWDGKFNKYQYLAFAYTYMGYNLKNPLFADKRVRQGLSLAIDTGEIVQGVLLGLGQPAVGPYKPGTWPASEKLKPLPFDPVKALELLAAAGWKDKNEQGVLVKDGHAFEFTILTNQGNDQRVKTATIVQNRLKGVGVSVKIRTVEWAALIKEFIDKGNFEAIILGWNITQDPDVYDVWHSSKAVPGGLNFIGYQNPELDDLLEKGRRMLKPEERKPVYDRIQEILREDQPYTFLYVPMALPLLSARINGVEPAPAGISHNFIKWWMTPGKAQ